jgi:hypothetical protein
MCQPLPVYPDKQTFSGSVGMSQTGPLADFPKHLNKVGFSSDIIGKEISDHGQGDSGRKFR